jgi:dodecin
MKGQPMVGWWLGFSPELNHVKERRQAMSESVYKVIELVGSSPTSWEDAAQNAVETAAKTLRDLRIAEVTQLDVKIEDGKITAYRAKVKLSFKYQT